VKAPKSPKKKRNFYIGPAVHSLRDLDGGAATGRGERRVPVASASLSIFGILRWWLNQPPGQEIKVGTTGAGSFAVLKGDHTAIQHHPQAKKSPKMREYHYKTNKKWWEVLLWGNH